MKLKDIDAILESNATRDELVSLKDDLLRAISQNPSSQITLGLRLARINLRIKEASIRERSYPDLFVDVARELLDPNELAMIERAVKKRYIENRSWDTDKVVDEEIIYAVKPPKKTSTLSDVARAKSVIKFDPVTLFREFGRDKVLACWSSLNPEDRPETAHEMRTLIRRKIASGE